MKIIVFFESLARFLWSVRFRTLRTQKCIKTGHFLKTDIFQISEYQFKKSLARYLWYKYMN